MNSTCDEETSGSIKCNKTDCLHFELDRSSCIGCDELNTPYSSRKYTPAENAEYLVNNLMAPPIRALLFLNAPLMVRQEKFTSWKLRHYAGERKFFANGKISHTTKHDDTISWKYYQLPEIDDSPRNTWLTVGWKECPKGAENLEILLWCNGEDTFLLQGRGHALNWAKGDKFMILDKAAWTL